MRSRFTAYALGEVRHLMRTTDPEGPHHRMDRGAWADELRRYCDATHFVHLDVVDSGATGDEGFVHFRARLSRAGEESVQEERSRFRRQKRRWLYVDGQT
jgi:SEC-C motif-containing protein